MKSPKYSCQVKQENDTWTAEICRKISKTSSTVSKAQSGFSTEAEAKAWGESELIAFLGSLDERNQRRAKKRG